LAIALNLPEGQLNSEEPDLEKPIFQGDFPNLFQTPKITLKTIPKIAWKSRS